MLPPEDFIARFEACPEALERAAEVVPILLVEQNLQVAQRLAANVVVIESGRSVHAGPAAEFFAEPERVERLLGVHA